MRNLKDNKYKDYVLCSSMFEEDTECEQGICDSSNECGGCGGVE